MTGLVGTFVREAGNKPRPYTNGADNPLPHPRRHPRQCSSIRFRLVSRSNSPCRPNRIGYPDLVEQQRPTQLGGLQPRPTGFLDQFQLPQATGFQRPFTGQMQFQLARSATSPKSRRPEWVSLVTAWYQYSQSAHRFSRCWWRV